MTVIGSPAIQNTDRERSGFDRLGLTHAFFVLAAICASAYLGVGSAARYAFVAAALAFGTLWLVRDHRRYLIFLICLFLFASLARRIIDHAVGYADSNVTLLAPYAVGLLTLAHAFNFLASGSRMSVEMIALVSITFWAFALGATSVGLGAIAVDTLRWFAPLAIFCFVMTLEDDHDLHKALTGPLTAVAVVAALYAVLQFCAPLPWDVYWVENAPIGSGPLGILGKPEPFQLRVFGTMNSPGSLAAALAALALLIFAASGPRVLTTLMLIFAAISLTQQRSVMGGLVVGILVLLALGASNLRLRILLFAAFGCVFVLVAISMQPDIVQGILQRFAVGGSLGDDGSLAARLRQLEIYPSLIAERPFGYGFGYRGVLSIENGALPFVLDNGFLDLLFNVGAPFGVVYLLALLSLVLSALAIGVVQRHFALCAACASICLLAQLPFGSVQTSEHGFFAFLSLALACHSKASSSYER